MTIKFREHRGSLVDSLATVTELCDFDALLQHVRALLSWWPSAPEVSAQTVHVKPYFYDDRIDWYTHVVTLDGYGVLGFTDGPVAPTGSAPPPAPPAS